MIGSKGYVSKLAVRASILFHYSLPSIGNGLKLSDLATLGTARAENTASGRIINFESRREIECKIELRAPLYFFFGSHKCWNGTDLILVTR